MNVTIFMNYIISFITNALFIYGPVSSMKYSIKNSISSSSTVQSCVDRRLRTGRCVNLAACPQLVEQFYAENIKVDFQTFISDFICGFDGGNFLICCVGLTVISIHPMRLQTSLGHFVATTSLPNYEPSFGSLFQFAPLSALSNGGNLYNTSPAPPAVTYQNPTNTPPIVFQPTTMSNSTVNPHSPPLVLSPIKPTLSPTLFKPMPTTPRIPYQTQQPVSSLQPPSGLGECGISRATTNRVVGGLEAKRDAYPWIASLGYYDEDDRNKLKFQCAGSLVSQRYVLTSAHCVSPLLAVVRLGAHDLSKSLEANSMDSLIRRTILHEAFDIRSIANDIALLELSTPPSMSSAIGAICLPEGDYFSSQYFVGMQPFVAGWGAAKHQGPTSNVLKDAQVPIVKWQTCESNYKTVFPFIEFSDKLICAGNSYADACQGDSGGPLMLPIQTSDGSYHYFLLGIVSYGYECARAGFPGVYTRVSSYMPWIRAHMV